MGEPGSRILLRVTVHPDLGGVSPKRVNSKKRQSLYGDITAYDISNLRSVGEG